jgi:hypothetical protein
MRHIRQRNWWVPVAISSSPDRVASRLPTSPPIPAAESVRPTANGDRCKVWRTNGTKIALAAPLQMNQACPPMASGAKVRWR